jgi:hypothetical protein
MTTKALREAITREHLASLAKLRRETGASQSRGKVADVRHP